MTNTIHTRPARAPVEQPPPADPSALLADASRLPGGVATRAWSPRHEGHVAWAVQHEPRLLAVGAQSSLTGGATPRGDAVLTTDRLNGLHAIEVGRVRVGPGVALVTLQAALRERGAFFPPAPTYDGALIGGAVSTNAAGAATWKYGTTRDWVEGLTVVLASGEVLDLSRGQARAEGGSFRIVGPEGETVVPVPDYAMPDVPKRSAGYHAAPGMDLVDLFVGAEGTLGVVTEVTLRTLEPEPPVATVLIAAQSLEQSIALTAWLREASERAWSGGAGIDVRAIECIDGRALALLREDGVLSDLGIDLSPSTAMVLLAQVELPPDLDLDEGLERYAAGAGEETPLTRLLDGLAARGVLDESELVAPGAARAAQLLALREAVPVAVNHRVRAAAQVDPGVHKVAGDMIVPFAQMAAAFAVYREEFVEARDLDLVVWGHISDGNVHPNVIGRSAADVERGHEALLACGRRLAALGGCPLSEHGVGRNPVKQALLKQLYGEAGLAAMRRTKQALDPRGVLGRDVVFPWLGD